MTSSAAPRQNRNPILEHRQRDFQHRVEHGGARRLTPRVGVSALVLSVALGAGGAALSACGAGEEVDGVPAFGNTSTFPNTPNGSAGNSGTTPANNGTNSGSNSGSQNGTGNTTAPPPASPPSNSNSNTPAPTPSNNTAEGNPSAPINNGTSMTGAMAAGNGGAGNGGAGNAGAGNAGMGMMPPPATTPNPPPVTPPPVPPVVTPPAAPDITCPAGATFCSGFESDTLPMGATYQAQPTVPLAFDTAVKHSGNRSLMVVSAGGFNIRQVIAPIPGQSFWVRLFVQTSNVFGDNNHDSLFVASTANPSQDNNAEDGPEFSEQGNQIVLNSNDALFSAAGAGFPQGAGPQLSANTWHCEEAFYDGGTGNTQIFSDGEEIITAPGYARRSYQTFRFGYIGFNTVRTVWFDDVVVSPTRVGCP